MAWVAASSHRLGKVMSPGGLPRGAASPFLGVSDRPVYLPRFLSIPPGTTFEVHFYQPGERMLIPEAGVDLDLCKGGRHGSHLSHPRVLPAISRKKGCFPATPPRSSKIIFLAHKSIPRKIPERFEKVDSFYCVAAGIIIDKSGHGCDCTGTKNQSCSLM